MDDPPFENPPNHLDEAPVTGDAPATAEPPSPPPPVPWLGPRALLVFLIVGLSGLCMLFFMVALLHEDRAALPWKDALVVVQDSPPWDGIQPAWVRPLPVESLSKASPFWQEVKVALESSEDGRMVLDVLALDKQERVVAVDVPMEPLAPLLESGRLPRRGANEVLAGDLARWDSFTLDGAAFRVVGRLTRGTSALLFGYLLSYDTVHAPLFEGSPEAMRAWFDPDGLARLAHMTPEEVDASIPNDAEVIGGLTRASTGIAFGNILGIALVVVGGAGCHVWLFQALARTRLALLHSLFNATAAWPRLFVAHHVVFFGLFLGVMVAGTAMPLANMRLMNVIQNIFQEGDLQYVGDAYASGNILDAAEATFINNYVRQTLVLTLAVSVVVPFFGLVKTALSFALAGFGMAPIWTSAIQVLPFHSITIALELEAYIVACFAVTLWPVYIVLGVAHRRVGDFAQGLAIMGSTAIVTAVLLALAALYEAATLILLRF